MGVEVARGRPRRVRRRADSLGADEAVARLWILNDLPLVSQRRTLYWRHAGRWLSGRKRPPAKRVRGVKLLRGFESLPSRHRDAATAVMRLLGLS